MWHYPFYLLLFSHSWVNTLTLEFAIKSTTGQTEELIESGTEEEQQHLVRLLPPGGEEERGSPACCRAPNVLSCSRASVNASLLTSQTSILLPGTNNLLTFANMVPPAGYHYQGMNGEEAILSISSTSGFLFGTLKTDGRAFTLEHCASGYHWLEYNVKDFVEEEEGFEDDANEDDSPDLGDVLADDDGGMVEYSVMIYFTPEFEAITSDIPGFVDQVLAETNQGYVNSNIPMTIKLHCIERATISDTASSSALMSNFMKMKKMSAAALHNAPAVN